ncbi:serine/threonine protein phosphatase 2A 57 kDa regulatory subunit B' beta isoform [Elaeis guineensis]|uniref:Serine/threonine protein phosphatase 2A regulatory subunit n=1 Tax=Elaeis guineensis var. tenera TaxID=51953 RepID=A0A6I9RZM9_ELAGV|nr:serine/threonine protein phosphatase 2A 57 kDa regulatory subunit B' beta isoform [Elaeis guineensis]
MGAPKTSPKAAPKTEESTTLESLFDLDSKANDISGATLLSPTSSEFAKDELISKISSCTRVFTFTDPAESPSQQDLKRCRLAWILSAIRSTKKLLDDRVLASLISMLSANLFRQLPLPSLPSLPSDFLDNDCLAMVLAPSWPHLHIVYDILGALVTHAKPKSLPGHIDHAFLLNLLGLFQSEDPRERDRLKNVYHQLYSKLTDERSFMRRSMSNVFLRFASDAERHSGIGELLEIWGSIINGFAVPLKEEHRVFLARVLVPLHKSKWMPSYYQQLFYCVSQFVQKEPELGGVVLRGILRYWPVTNCHKEVLIIGELEDLVESLCPSEFEKLAVPLCSQIAKCLSSCNSQVAERALYVWNNEQFVRMASRCMEKILPAIVQGIEKNLSWHWSKSVQELTMSVKTMLEEMEPELYSKCLQELAHRESVAEQEEIKRKVRWERLERAAANNNCSNLQIVHVSPNNRSNPHTSSLLASRARRVIAPAFHSSRNFGYGESKLFK